MSNKAKFIILFICGAASLSVFAQPMAIPIQGPQPVENRLSVPTLPSVLSQLPLTPPAKYRDPSVPLTIGEMSEMSARKAQTDFLQRQGYSTNEPMKVTATPQTKKSLGIETLAIWGGNQSQAELLINGRVIRVQGGETLANGVFVQSVSRSSVELAITKPTRKGKKSDTQIRTLSTGQTTEISL